VLNAGADLTPVLLSELGLGLIRSGPRQHHVAFVYEGLDGAICLSHLASHRDFRGKDVWNTRYYWTSVRSIDALNRKVCSSWLTALANNSQETIGFGIDDSGCRFVDDGSGEVSYVCIIPGKGLTCATFVMSVLERLGFPLLARETWLSRPEDAEWQRQILDALRSAGRMTPDEVELASKDIGCIRFKPIEVAGAGALPHRPVEFAGAVAEAEAILAAIAPLRFDPIPTPAAPAAP
jgi:hypothetical protein